MLSVQVARRHTCVRAIVLEQLGMGLMGADSVATALPHLLALKLFMDGHAEHLDGDARGVQV